jgi:uncharacterized membrane protein YoaK (UPF0700 family)
MSAKRNARCGVPLMVLALALTVVAGATDVAAFTRLGGCVRERDDRQPDVARPCRRACVWTARGALVVAFAGYVAGVALGSRIGVRSGGDALWSASVTVILLIELIVYGGLTVGWELTGGSPGGTGQLVLLAAATVAMGLQAAAVRDLGRSLSTTYLTGTLTAAVASLVTGGNSRDNRLNIGVLIAHASGATAAGGLILSVPAALPALPVAILSGVITTVMTVGTRE